MSLAAPEQAMHHYEAALELATQVPDAPPDRFHHCHDRGVVVGAGSDRADLSRSAGQARLAEAPLTGGEDRLQHAERREWARVPGATAPAG